MAEDKKFEFVLSTAVPDDTPEIVEFLNSLGKESTFSNTDPVLGHHLTEEDCRKGIEEDAKNATGRVIVARVKGFLNQLCKLQVTYTLATHNKTRPYTHTFESVSAVKTTYYHTIA